MAVFRSSVFTSPTHPPPSFTTVTRISISVKVIRCSSIPIPKRKNYLRPKILRTLTPNPHDIESPPIFPPSETISNEEENSVKEEIQLSSSILSNLSPKTVAKYGLCLVGIFVFQTVVTVLFLGTDTEKPPSEKSEGRLSLLDDVEMSEKIEEIRLMAREARRSEEKSGKGEGDEGLNIEREIEVRLSSMERRLNSQRKGLAGLRVDDVDDELRKGDGLEDEKSLLFEKKYKFKDEKRLMGDVKGFGGSKVDNEVVSGKSEENGNVSDSRDGEKNSEEEQNDDGAAQESEERVSDEDKEPRSAGSVSSGKPNVGAGTGFGKTSLSGKRGEVGKGKPMRRVREQQYEKENKMWWLKLPYVLRILMRSNIEEEISEGYFTLRTESEEQNEDQISHIVAFEDQNDARNFSYLLESVFEDLDDFSADVVPISTKDLYEEVSTGGKNVIVVKKRQLTLYAGQPFEDVEKALETLIQEQ